MAGTYLQAIIKGMEPKLYRAALGGSFEDMTSISNWKEQTTPIGNNILHIHVGKPLHKASKNHKKKVSIDFIREVLYENEGYSLLCKENNNGEIPLHLACRFGLTEVVQMFLERAKEVDQEDVTRILRMANKKKDTALHEAARGSHAAVVKLLVEANPNCSHEANDEGETPLYLAAERGSTASVATILGTCQPSALGYDHKGPCGRTPLHAAVHWGNPEMVRKMLEKETSLIRVQDDEGLTPLHCAAAEISKIKLLKVLLHYDNEENESSALYIQDNKGRTPLHIALLRCNWDVIRKFIKCRPDCIEIVDKHGQSAVHYAAKWGCLTKFSTFLDKGHFEYLVNDKDVDGNTPLHLFATSIPKLGHDCISMLPTFVKFNNHFLDFQAFNKQNFTVGDILKNELFLMPNIVLQLVSDLMIPRGKRINIYEGDVDIEKAVTSSNESKIISVRKEAQGQSLIATLIATVSFAAGFTLPGGFIQNPGENIGMAVLKSKAAFKTFLISDAIAFTCSTIAILNYFVLVTTDSTLATASLSTTAMIFNTISLGALMLAFTTGVSAVVSQSPHLVLALWAISMVFFYRYVILIFRNVRVVVQHFTKCSSRNHQFVQKG